jgi:hypothetical protein
MRTGFSLDQIAAILDVDRRKAGQAIDPAIVKVAKLMRVDTLATLEMIMDALRTLDGMSDQEIALRELMLTGRMNHPPANGR